MQNKLFFPQRTIKRILFTAFLGLSCQGCQLIAPYQTPCTPTPLAWKNTPSSNFPDSWKTEEPSKEADTDRALPNEMPEQKELNFEECKKEFEYWWEVFEDSTLSELEKQALDSSYTLWAALERVIQARAVARVDRAALMPSINFAPSYSRSGMLLENIFAGLLSSQQNQGQVNAGSSSGAAGAASTSVPSSFRAVQTQYMLPFDLNYELDLWYQLTNSYNAAVYSSQAAAQAYLSVLLTLTADIASNYFQLRDLDTQQVILKKTIEARQKALDINRTRFKAGLIVYLDVSRAEVELARAQADLADVQRLRALQVNILASLVGVPAPVFTVAFNPLKKPPPTIPAGLPSDLLYRRPDITEAERSLASAYSQIGVAYASFFPSLNLNATLGLESPFAHSLFSWKARLWEVGLNVMQSVFDGGRNCANLAYTKSVFRETLANYQERVLTAFQDVEDSLVSIRQRAIQGQALETAVTAAKETLNLSQMRYDRGLVNYLDVVDAERTLLETEQNSAIVLGDRYVATVRLIKALGGGWGEISYYPRCWETD